MDTPTVPVVITTTERLSWQPTARVFAALLVALSMAACGDEGASGDPDMGPGRNDPRRTNGRDVGRDANADGGVDLSADLGVERDSGIDLFDDEPDSAPDVVTSEDIPPGCGDADNDGYGDIACGGGDCDDHNDLVNPGTPEFCDFLDNDCVGGVNQGLDCSFYAHSGNTLYLLDPFAGSVEEVADVPGLWDIDTHPDGTLYGVNASTLWRFEPSSSTWRSIASISIPGDTNGMAIDLGGTAFLTSGNVLTEIDLSTGSTDIIGSMGGNYDSSGDCVINKDNTLFMSSDIPGNDDTDLLVTIDGSTGVATTVGPIGFVEVYALTAAWGFLFGLTDLGEVIIIDEETGAGSLVTTIPGTRFYGAASTPGR